MRYRPIVRYAGFATKNGVAERQNKILKSIVNIMICHFTLLESLLREALRLQQLSLIRFQLKQLLKPLTNFGWAKNLV